MWLANASKSDAEVILRTWPILFTGSTDPPELILDNRNLVGIHINSKDTEQCLALNEQSGLDHKDA